MGRWKISFGNDKEQQDIVSNLNKIANVIRLRRLELVKIDELVKSQFIEMFGDPERNDNQLGTKNDYMKTATTPNLAVFIRSLVGLDQKAINEKFGQYLNDNVLNAQQQEFIKTIIMYVNENGDIETSDLLNTSPFDDQDILELFGEKLQILQYIVNTVHGVVQVAA